MSGEPQRRALAGLVSLIALSRLGGSPCWAAERSASLPPEQTESRPTAASASQRPITEPAGTDPEGDLWSRPTLSGDWFGARSSLEDFGVTFAARVTHFGFGVAGGIDRPVPAPLGEGDTHAYTGRGEYELIFDLDKLVGLPKGRLLVRAEHWFGQYGNVGLRVGSFAPAVFPAACHHAPTSRARCF